MAVWPPVFDKLHPDGEFRMTEPYDASPIAAKVLGREPLRPPLPKRFYKAVAVIIDAGQHVIQLDARNVRTPKKQLLALPTAALAQAVAEEWRAQVNVIDPATMPLTKIANTVIDGIIGQETATADEITRFAGTDLLCYRADNLPTLHRRQELVWDPIIAGTERRLAVKFITTAGIVHIEQPALTAEAVARRLAACDAYQLAAAHIMTTLTGSAILALARLDGVISAADAWRAAHVDEDYQIELWGPDDEAAARRAYRWTEMQAADRLLTLL
jgi:chaperone required for assembly of F1-ATPase